jgi:hypothetical protein
MFGALLTDESFNAHRLWTLNAMLEVEVVVVVVAAAAVAA